MNYISKCVRIAACLFTLQVAAEPALAVPPTEPVAPSSCSSDRICNRSKCVSDPDCPDVPQPPKPSRPSDILDCSSLQTQEIGFAIDWGASQWTSFEATLEAIRDWPVNIGKCLENRFKTNGRIVCERENKGWCNKALAWASPLNQKCHLCPRFLDAVAKNISGTENRQACYFAMAAHELGHTCERGHKVLEIVDDEAFLFWKSKHPGVTIDYSDCPN